MRPRALLSCARLTARQFNLEPALALVSRDLVGLTGTFLGDISEQSRDALLRDATLLEVRRGHRVFDRGGSVPRVALVVEGTVRTYLVGRNGRQVTVRFARGRSIVTTSTPGMSGFRVTIGLQAINDCTLAELSVNTLTALQSADTHLNRVFVEELTRRIEDVYRAFMSTAQGTMRERLAAVLLETAEPDQHGSLTAHVSQRDLATWLGTAREVVSRTLAELQRDGLVETGRRGIVVPRPTDLVGQAWPWWTPSVLFASDASADPRSALDASPIPVLAFDNSGSIVYASPSAAATFGWSVRELVGRPLTDLMPPDAGEPIRAALADFVATAGRGPIGLRRPLRGQRADGSVFPAELSMISRSAGGGAIFVSVLDVSYRAALRRLLSAPNRSADAEPTRAT